MFYEVKSLSNLAIISLDSNRILGTLNEIIIDPENGKILGLLVNAGILGKKKAVSFNDIYDWTPQGIMVRDDEAITNIDDLVRIKKIVEEKISIIGSKVVTENEKKLGKVVDFVINTDLGILVKIYVEKPGLKTYFGDLLIIPANRIIAIKPKKIIVREEALLEETDEEEEVVGQPVVM